MRRVGLVADARFERHRTGVGFPESPERLSGLPQRLWEGFERLEPVAATDAQLLRVHDADHLRRVGEACRRGDPFIDSMDVPICAESDEVARLAAGSVSALACAIAEGRFDRGFAAVRPPGHHAERDLAMGFCLYNTVAVAAAELLARKLAERVMIVDWDVHHGNGTQHIFEESPDVYFFSVHQSPLYPGTGAATERGRGPGEGTTLNCPLPAGSGDAPYLATLSGPLATAAATFRPDFMILSAGFDAHAADPLAQLDVSTEAFVEATKILCGIADKHCGGRLLSSLEGGYDLTALREAIGVHLDGLRA